MRTVLRNARTELRGLGAVVRRRPLTTLLLVLIAALLAASIALNATRTQQPLPVQIVPPAGAAAAPEVVAENAAARYPGVDTGKLAAALRRGELYAWSIASGGVELCRSFLATPDGRIWSLDHGRYPHAGARISTRVKSWDCSTLARPTPADALPVTAWPDNAEKEGK